MCGIAGIVSADASRLQTPLAAMVSAIRHRGPDGCRSHLFERCALGHARLSIIDLSGGDQPMFTSERRAAIVFNGEIYGYQALRESVAYPYQNHSDSEVILALYRKYGHSMLEHLPGMFAFAIWDEDKGELFCGRDRFGEKPFFYASTPDGRFLFASELKAIVASGLVDPRVRRASLTHYLVNGYVHPAHTIYENIHTLPPAHGLVFRDRTLRVWRYWHPPPERRSIGLSEAVEEFTQRFRTAVEKQLIADVNVGALLSGGLDSSNVVAAAVRKRADLHTYAFGLAGELDERPYARAVASHFNTVHRDVLESAVDVPSLLRTMPAVYDEPFADPSCVPTYVITGLAARQEKVVLTGDGGDELLGGYPWYRPYLAAHGRPDTLWMRQAAAGLLSIPETLFRKSIRPTAPRRHRDEYLQLAAVRDHGSVRRAYALRQKTMSDAELARLGLPPQVDEADLSHRRLYDDAGDVMMEDVEHYLPGDILVKTDRASMAHGLELRAPFLDVDLASFCLSLPLKLRISGTSDKIVLREAFARDLPEVVRDRPKRGFGADYSKWLLDPAIRTLTDEFVTDRKSPLYDLVAFDAVQPLASRSGAMLWRFLVLGLWAGHVRPRMAA